MTPDPLPGSHPREQKLYPIFRFVQAKAWWVIAVYAALLAAAVPFALRVGQDNAIDRLIVRSDPDYVKTQEFAAVFGSGEYVVLFAEAADPFAPEVIRRFAAIEEKLRTIEHLESNSILAIYRQAKPDADPAADPAAFRAFALGTELFADQGLIGATFFGMPLIFEVETPEARAGMLSAIDEATREFREDLGPLKALRRVGAPYVNEYLNRGTAEGGMRLFPVFGAFVVILVLSLYRSWRTLLAFIVSMAVNVALAVGWIGLTGGTFTIVSALVPMTILITCLATLVYIHSRFVERPPERQVDEHQVFALANKFLACTASIFATAVGFAALVVSDIRPIREMGVWVAIGLVFTWFIVFSLFPALQKVLRTPTQVERHTAAQWFRHVTEWLPHWSWRWRWVTVPLSLALCAVGAVSLFGLPGVIDPMKMLTDPIDYVPADSEIARDTRAVEDILPGLSPVDVWLKGKVGSLNQPEVLRGLDAFQDALGQEPLVGSAVGPTTVLRMLRYVGGHGDKLPQDPEALVELTDELEGLAQQEPLLGRFVDRKDMAQTHVMLVTRINEYPIFEDLGERIEAIWRDLLPRHPGLFEFSPGAEERWAAAWKEVAAKRPGLTEVDAADALRAWTFLAERHPRLADLPPAEDPLWAALKQSALDEYPELEPALADPAAFFGDVVAAGRAMAAAVPAPELVGLGRLQTKVSYNLVPTLTESFVLTVAIIFSVFLIIFRNGAARLMAMIPSLFAILVMFAIMRLLGMSLNVATILIASTVLGTSENDQIHFFYHFLERKQGKGGSTEQGLRHTLLIAGRSIFFATLINAIGFLAFALSDLPPIRQFAILAAVAFVLSMLADFTALPGALWMVFRDKPDTERAKDPGAAPERP